MIVFLFDRGNNQVHGWRNVNDAIDGKDPDLLRASNYSDISPEMILIHFLASYFGFRWIAFVGWRIQIFRATLRVRNALLA